MNNVTHIRTSRRFYYGAIVMSILVFLQQCVTNNQTLTKTISGTIGILACIVVIYSLYKIFSGKGAIILSDSGFKIRGYDWKGWDELVSVYPYVENDFENGSKNYIKFRLKDGTDLSVRSEYLEMTFEEIATLVNKYRGSCLL
jgi:hypothetical protein